MRSLWKGAISFGLVNIPVKLYTATENKDVRFNYLHKECHTPIRYEKVCPTCEREVAQDEIVKGFEYQPGHYVIMEEELESLAVEQTKTIDIIDFVKLDEIDPIFFDRTYYLEPAQGGLKPYSLLRETMKDTGRIAIAKIAIRSKQSLACVRVYDQALAMETMHYPDEIRKLDQLAGLTEEPSLHPNELKMAKSLVENLSEPFDPQKYQNEYRKSLNDLIEKKIAGEEIETAPAPKAQGNVVDLMAALEASLKATKGSGKAKKKRKPAAKKEA